VSTYGMVQNLYKVTMRERILVSKRTIELKIKICLQCGTRFVAHKCSSNVKYCSEQCYREAQKNLKRFRILKKYAERSAA
jgi:hypothetical protein